MPTMRTFICYVCQRELEKDWSDAAAMAEAQLVWGKDIDPRELAVVCGDCWERVLQQAFVTFLGRTM